MPVERGEWHGLLRSRGEITEEGLLIEQPLTQSAEGGSGVFLARASDGQRWWVKPQNNLQGPKVAISEYVVGRMGSLIGAPTCEVRLARIPDEIAGWEFRQGARLEAGYAHASRNVEDAQLLRSLDYRQRDNNRQRHAGVIAIYDWCWGADDQWLYSQTDDLKLYSHDHGHYFPGGPDWSEATLVPHVDEPHQPAHSTDDLDQNALKGFAVRLEQVDRGDLVPILSSVPSSWSVTETDLESLGYFLERRASPAAGRLRSI